jgi:hypothetical protein
MRRLRALGIAITLASAMATTGTASATVAPTAATPQTSDLAEIMTYYGFDNNRGQHFCLDAEDDANGNPYQNGDKVQMWTCQGGLNQQWTVNTLEGAIINKMSGKCLDAENEPPSPTPWNNGDTMQLWDCNGYGQQLWTEGPVNNDGFYGIQNDDTLDTMCLDGQADSNNNPNNNGDRVQLWQCNGQDQQMWTFVYLV